MKNTLSALGALLFLLLTPSVSGQAREDDPALLLARTCVSERGWRLETDDCAAIYEVALVRSRRHHETLAGALRALSPRLHGTGVSRSWLTDLDVDAHLPRGWRGARWTARGGCALTERRGRCVARREDWVATLEQARALVTGTVPRVCASPPTAWGSTSDLRAGRARGGVWAEISCGETRNHFGVWLDPRRRAE